MSGFDWMEYLKLARRLSTQKDEASLRSALSRSYYCVFHLALARAESNSYVSSRQGSSHRDLWSVYQASPVFECKELAVIGRRTKDRPVVAYYDASFPKLEKTLEDTLMDVERFVVLMAKLDPRHPNPLP